MPRTKDPPPSREVRLHVAYVNLTFSCTSSHQDVRREELFRRLVLHHLLCHNVYTALDWRNIKTQQLCTYNFLQDYAKQLWPGKKAERLHLANPALTPRARRSFIGAIDDHWSVRRNGPAPRPQQVASDSELQSPGGAQMPSPQVGYGLNTFVGNMALSKVGKTFAKYVEVLLEPGLESAQMEDVEKLIEGILSTEYGGEIEAMPMSDGDQTMPSSDGIESMPMSDPVIKVEEGSD